MFEVLTTVTFAEQNGKTKQTMRARVIKTTAQAAQYLAGMEAGWTQSLERLAKSLAKDLTAEQRKMPGCLHDGGCPNPDNASQDRAERGLETKRRFA